jgi:hypothetical protein
MLNLAYILLWEVCWGEKIRTPINKKCLQQATIEMKKTQNQKEEPQSFMVRNQGQY